MCIYLRDLIPPKCEHLVPLGFSNFFFGKIGKIPEHLGCDFFERRGEKRIDVGTLLTFRKNFVSDGVLCFWSILCVILLSVEVKTICKYACAHNRHIDVYTWNPYLHTCNPNLLTSGSLSLSTFIAAATAAAPDVARCHLRCFHRRLQCRRRRHRFFCSLV